MINRRSVFSFLAAAPVGVFAAVKGTSANAAASGFFKPRHLTEHERAEFKRMFFVGDEKHVCLAEGVEFLESRRFKIDEICKFMGVRVQL